MCAIVCNRAGLCVLFVTADVLNHLNLDETLTVSILAKIRCWSPICTCTRTLWGTRFGKRICVDEGVQFFLLVSNMNEDEGTMKHFGLASRLVAGKQKESRA